MGKILKFEPKSIEDKFMESLTEQQLEMFLITIEQAKSDYENAEHELWSYPLWVMLRSFLQRKIHG